MKPLLIAVVLAAMQAHSPAPGTAANTPADDGKSVNKHTQNEKNPTAKTTPAPEAAGSHVDQKTGGMAADDAHQAISIRELPPVSVKRDRIDWLALALTGALVIVGALGVCYAIKTLKGIERQANANEGQLREIKQSGEQTNKLITHAEKQAEATLLHAKAIINSERAWVDLDFMPVHPGAARYYLRAINHGKTPGFVTERLLGRAYWTGDIGEIPAGFTGHVVPEKERRYDLIPANAQPATIWNFDVKTFPPGEEGQIVTYHGQVAYKDIFGQQHRTEVVYGLKGGSVLEYLPRYTRYVTKTEQGEKAS